MQELLVSVALHLLSGFPPAYFYLVYIMVMVVLSLVWISFRAWVRS